MAAERSSVTECLWVQGEILAANILPGVDWLLPSAAHSVGRAPRRILEEKMTSVVALGAGFRNVLIACSSAKAEQTSSSRSPRSRIVECSNHRQP